MTRWLWMLDVLVVGGVATALAQPASVDEAGLPDGPPESRRADGDDHGRPVEKIAKELGVSPEKFREVFKRVKPAARGEVPSKEQREANRKVLCEGLGVSPERLDEVMDKYRPEGPDGGGVGRRRTAGGNIEGRPAERGERGPNGRGPRGRAAAPDRGQPHGPPPHNSQRFVEHALQFDADKDGKLDRAELMQFADAMGRRRDERERAGPPHRDRGGPEGEGPAPRDHRSD